nr:reverse transcriptase domain-containing protein [Tanacetum cinerariifolium]
ALIDRGVAAALAERDADRSRNGDNINDSGTGGRRQTTTPRECFYTDFLKCQPMNFQGTEGVKFDETFSEAWDRFKDLLCKCPHHGFLELHQIDKFYNSFTQSDQDSLNAAASGNHLNCTARDALTIIENNSKVRTLRNKQAVSKVNTTTSSSSPSLDITALTDIVKELVLMNKANQQASVKVIEETCRQSPSGLESLPSDTVANMRGDMKAITTQSGVAYDGPSIPPTSSFPKEVEREPEVTTDKDLGASINIMPLSVWKKILLPKLTPTRMTLELANRSVAYLVVNQIDVIDVACEEYAQEVFGFLDSSTSGNPTPSDPIVASSSPSFTPFEGGDFILEEIETFLCTLDELYNLDDDYYDTKGDILYLEKLLNKDPSSNLPLMNNEDLKQVDVTMTKPSIEEPSELELKDFPPHLEYSFLEGTDKLPVIISRELKDEEKAALLKVLKSHKRAIAWKISDIMGIDSRFCTHKILMKDDFKPVVQHQRRETMEFFMDDFSVFEDSFSSCLSYLDKMLKRCEDTNLVLNLEKCHFMVKEGIVLGHKISKLGIEVEREKVNFIAKLPHSTSVKGVRTLYNKNQGNYQVLNNQGRGQNFNQGNNNYQALNNQAQVGPSNDFSNYIKTNDVNMRAMQNQISNMKIELKNEFKTTMLNQNNKLRNMMSNEIKNMMSSFILMKSPLGSGLLPSNTVANPRGDLKAITTQSGVAYDGPTIPPTPSPLPKEVKRKTKATKDKTNPKPSIPYPSRLNDQKLCEKANNQMLKFFQIFQRLHFDISFADALLHMPKFASMFKSLLSNKEKLFKSASTLLNENCSAVLLKKLPKKLRDPDMFLPCDFSKLEECLALADLGASINLKPLSVWKKLSLPELTPTRMTLELANRSVAYPVGVAKDVFVKVGKFYFSANFVVVDYDVDPRKKLPLPDLTPTRMTLELATRSIAYPATIAEDVFVQVGKFTFPADFVVVDYDVDPRIPLILRRSFLRTAHALVDVHEEELILRDDDEKLIFHADSTSKHPHKHGNESINMINFIDITCKDFFPGVLKFKKSNHPLSGSTTPLYDSFPSPIPFATSDSLLEEFADELALLDPPSRKKDNNFDFQANHREIELFLNQDPSTKSNIETIDPILEKFTDEPSLDYLPHWDDDDDDIFDLKSNKDEWKNLLYGDCYKDIDFEKDKNKDFKMKSLVVEAYIVVSNDLLPRLLDSDSTLPKESAESSEIASLSLSPFGNKDKVFNPGMHILGRDQILKDESKDIDLKDKDLILEDREFLSISSDQEFLFFLALTVIETLLLFSFENEDKVFNPEIPYGESKMSLVDETWREIKGSKWRDSKFVMTEGLGLKLNDAPEDLESSHPHYK